MEAYYPSASYDATLVLTEHYGRVHDCASTSNPAQEEFVGDGYQQLRTSILKGPLYQDIFEATCVRKGTVYGDRSDGLRRDLAKAKVVTMSPMTIPTRSTKSGSLAMSPASGIYCCVVYPHSYPTLDQGSRYAASRRTYGS